MQQRDGDHSADTLPESEANGGRHLAQPAAAQQAARAAARSAQALLARMRLEQSSKAKQPSAASRNGVVVKPRLRRMTLAQLQQLYGRKARGQFALQPGPDGEDGERRSGSVAATQPASGIAALPTGAQRQTWEWMLEGVLWDIINMLDVRSLQAFRQARAAPCRAYAVLVL